MKCCLPPFPQLFLWNQLFKLDTFQSEEGFINTCLRAKDIYQTASGNPKCMVTCTEGFWSQKEKKQAWPYLEQMVQCKQMTWRKQNGLTPILALLY